MFYVAKPTFGENHPKFVIAAISILLFLGGLSVVLAKAN